MQVTPAKDNTVTIPEPSAEEKCGIEIVGLNLSAGGYMIDFRYRVLDPAKAQPLLERRTKPYLIHQETGAKLHVPRSAKVGPLRQTALRATQGSVYWMFFANPGRMVKPGNKVTVVIGDFQARDVTAQ